MAEQVVSQVVGKVKGDISDLKTKYKEAKSETSGLKGFFGSMMKDIASTAMGVLTGSAIQQGISSLVGGFKDLVSQGFNFNATLEDLQTSFTTLLHSSSDAKTLLSQLYTFAAKTPFQFQDLAQDASAMLAEMGVSAKEIVPDLTAIGDAAASLPGTLQDNAQRIILALGQMHTHTTVDAQDMMQLTSLGINAWGILADKMHMTVPEVQKLASQGLLPADDAVQTLLGSFENLYGGGMAKKSANFNGLVSTLKDNLSQALGTLTGPLFKDAEQGLSGLVGWMSSPSVQNFIQQVGQDLANGLQNAGKFLDTLKQDFLDAFNDKNGEKVKKLKDLAKDLGDKLKDLGDWIKQHGKQALEDLATAAGHVSSWVADLKQHIQDVHAWFVKWEPEIYGVSATLTAFFLPAIIKSGVESVIAGGKIAANFVMSIINAGKEAVISAGKLWLGAGSFVLSMLESGNTAETSAAKVEGMAAAETAVGTEAEASAAVEGLAAAEDAAGTSAEGATAKIGAMATAEEGAGAAATGAIGTAGAGAVGGAGGIGLLGFIAAMTGLAYAMDQSDKVAASWATDLHNWLTGVQNDYFGLSVAAQQANDSANILGGTFDEINTFFANTPFLGNMNDLRNILLNIADAEANAAEQAQLLDTQWAQTHIPNLGDISNDNPTPQNGHPHALGGMVGPREMLSLLNDQNGYGELVKLRSGDIVYTHQQSVTMLQQMQQPQVPQRVYSPTITIQGVYDQQVVASLVGLELKREALLHGI